MNRTGTKKEESENGEQVPETLVLIVVDIVEDSSQNGDELRAIFLNKEVSHNGQTFVRKDPKLLELRLVPQHQSNLMLQSCS